VAAVADLGLNVIRVPVWYQALETDGPDPVAFRPEGWKHLDDIARWARRHAVWVIIDLHGAPGGQNAADHSGLMDGGHLAAEPRCVERTARLWQALASYFEGDPHVAAFDLLNEPWSLSTEDSYRAVHQAIYEAIRQVDGDHAVMIEDGYLPASVLSSPKEMGWTNALFSIHLYPDANASAEKYAKGIRDGIEALEDTYHWSTRFACPAFLGEFSSAGSGAWAADAMDRAIGELDGRGIHWAAWTWKFGEDSTWGVWHPKAPARIDVKDATEEAIRQAFAGLDSASFEPNEAYAAALRAHAADPVLPLDP
jgi:aryl-phospho-beta-D-glucosidase BglC (GH1 family)